MTVLQIVAAVLVLSIVPIAAMAGLWAAASLFGWSLRHFPRTAIALYVLTILALLAAGVVLERFECCG
jgi:hypothetical protein